MVPLRATLSGGKGSLGESGRLVGRTATGHARARAVGTASAGQVGPTPVMRRGATDGMAMATVRRVERRSGNGRQSRQEGQRQGAGGEHCWNKRRRQLGCLLRTAVGKAVVNGYSLVGC